MKASARRKNGRTVSMGGPIRARVTRGVLEPMVKIDLLEGREVTITIVDILDGRGARAFHRAAGGWKGTVDADRLIRNVHADRLVRTRSKPRL